MKVRRYGGRLVLAVAVVFGCAAELAAQERRAMTVVDMLEIPSIGNVQLSPDGRQVLYVRSDADWERNTRVSHIWRVDIDGSGTIQLTNGHDGESSPRWSPDGAAIAFLAERGDAEDRQIYLISNAAGEARQLTEHATSVSNITWSPDGRWIYFTATNEKSDEQKKREEAKEDVYAFEEDYRQHHLWRVEVATGTEERLSEGDFSVLGYELSRDGGMIALERGPNPLYDDVRLREAYVMDAAPGAAMRRLTENDVPEYRPTLAPDNRTVMFLADSNEEFESYYNDNIFLVPADGGPARILAADVPYEFNGAIWSRDGRGIFAVANTGVRRDIFRVDVESRRIEQLTPEGDHTVGSVDYVPAADRFVYTLSSATSPGDIWTMDGRGRGHRQVTHVFDYIAGTFRLPRVEAIRWPGEDGVSVEGLLFYPNDYVEGERYPLVVQTHGGPASSDKFSCCSSGDYAQKLTAMGYMVFQPNYRGSTGYGDDFLRDMVPGYFDQAHRDVMAGVDHLIEHGLVDGDRMAKMGWSAGGHMTNKIITFTDRFAAAASGAGAANWISMYAQSDVRFYRTPWFGGSPWEEGAPIEMYWEHSPLKYVSDVTTPTIFLVGENDPRVPMPQSVEMYRALEANGVPTHLYVAPREQHGWRELRHRLFKVNVELDWFERWVRDREYEWEEAPETDEGAGG